VAAEADEERQTEPGADVGHHRAGMANFGQDHADPLIAEEGLEPPSVLGGRDRS
jgi:hypothetical protein